MDQILPLLFAILSLIVVLQIAFSSTCGERDRRIRNTDLRRPTA